MDELADAEEAEGRELELSEVGADAVTVSYGCAIVEVEGIS